MPVFVVVLLILGAFLLLAVLPASLAGGKGSTRRSRQEGEPGTISGTDRGIEPSGITPTDANFLDGGGL